jgi:hypothetical protein
MLAQKVKYIGVSRVYLLVQNYIYNALLMHRPCYTRFQCI